MSETDRAATAPLSETKIALIGNPNAGKTTLFNRMTGASQRTGNWPGVTVERKTGEFQHDGKRFEVVDLPGVYMLDGGETSVDEQITRQFLLNNKDYLYINILDASTLERGLFLTTEVLEQGVKTIVFLNMMDVADKRGMHVDVDALSARLGCPVVVGSLKKDRKLQKLCQTVLSADELNKPVFNVKYTDIIEAEIQARLAQGHSRAEAVNHVRDDQVLNDRFEQETGDDLGFLLADARFEQACEIAGHSIKHKGKVSRTRSDKIDKWVLGEWTGIPVFLALMYLLFLFSINIGGAFIDFFDQAVGAVLVDGGSHWLGQLGAPAWLSTLLADGVGGGIQIVATFIPVIGALFLFLTVLEESGYMSRAAFVMDRFMRVLGISGKAFVPLIVGFGCNVPGIMATRTLDSQRERILTVMMAPFMSCGARLAVYVLFASAFFPTGGQNMVFLLYLIGILFAIATGFLLRKTLLKGEANDFYLELPTYQVPSLKNILLNTWNKLKGFVLGAGKVIVIVVALINIANSLGADGSFGNQDTEHSVLSAAAKKVTPVFGPMGIHDDNWPATVGIISGLLAKEVVVGTLDALYSGIDQVEVGGIEQTKTFSLTESLQDALATIPSNLQDAMGSMTDPLGLGVIKETSDQAAAAEELEVSTSTYGAMVKRFDGKIGAFAYLLFILMYFPCVAATGAMYREVGSRWAMLGVAWTTGLAYTVAVMFYQLATFAQHPMQSIIWVAVISILLAITVVLLYRAGLRQNDTLTPMEIS